MGDIAGKSAYPGGAYGFAENQYPPWSNGLTFREALIVAALTGSANIYTDTDGDAAPVRAVVETAMTIADETIRRLEEGDRG